MALLEPLQLPDDHPSADRVAFRQAFRRHPASVVVVTYIDATGAPRGMTATAMTALSADPPSLIVCIDRATRTYEEVMHVRTFAIDMLAASQRRISQHCSKPGADKRLDERWLAPRRRARRPAPAFGRDGTPRLHDRFGPRCVHPHGRRGPRSGDLAESAEPSAVALPRRRLHAPGDDHRRRRADPRGARPAGSRLGRRLGARPFRVLHCGRQRGSIVPRPSSSARSDDRVREHDVGEADTEVGDHDATARRTGRAREDRLADRGGRIRDNRRTGRRRGSPGTGPGRRQGTEPRRAPRTPRTSWRSRPGRRARPVRATRRPSTCRRAGSVNVAAVMTTSASTVAARGSSAPVVAVAEPMPAVARAMSASASARSG